MTCRYQHILKACGVVIVAVGIGACVKLHRGETGSASPQSAKPLSPVVDGRPVILHLVGRDKTLTVVSGQTGRPAFHVTDAKGNVLLADGNIEQLRSRYPEIHSQFQSAIATDVRPAADRRVDYTGAAAQSPVSRIANPLADEMLREWLNADRLHPPAIVYSIQSAHGVFVPLQGEVNDDGEEIPKPFKFHIQKTLIPRQLPPGDAIIFEPFELKLK